MRLFTERELKLIGIGVGAATLIALAIAIPVSLSRRRPAALPTTTAPTSRRELDVTDLAVPDDLREIDFTAWEVYRPRLKRWNAEQIERFWIDPELLELERLGGENDAMIRGLFDQVP